LAAICPFDKVRSSIKIRKGRLIAGHFSIPLPDAIRVIAVGKASYSMFEAAIGILRDHVVSGILVVPKNTEGPVLSSRFRVFYTGHPLPDKEGARASEKIIQLIEGMQKDELLLCLI
jgi:glycerate 2-kinase